MGTSDPTPEIYFSPRQIAIVGSAITQRAQKAQGYKGSIICKSTKHISF
jgi:hypothetical protein